MLTVIDAERYDVLSEVVGPLLEGQIAQADVIAVNKCDAVSAAEQPTGSSGRCGLGPSAPVLAVSAPRQCRAWVPLMENVL